MNFSDNKKRVNFSMEKEKVHEYDCGSDGN